MAQHQFTFWSDGYVRLPKNIYYYYQSWWSDKDVLHISPHWNWPGKEGKPIDVWINSNADDVELFLNGKSLGKKDMARNSHLQWNVNYEPDTLEAIAYKKGKKITTKVETADKASEVVITPYKTTLLDPSSHEPDKVFDNKWQRKLFNGKCQFIVQSGTKEDFVHIEATSDGLYKASTDIATIIPSTSSNKTNSANNFIKKKVDKMLGADISFLPELEARGMKFSDKGVENDAIEILKDHGFNYVRLRIFNDPAADSGYSPKKGFCDLQHTLEMAKRIKKAGLKIVIGFSLQ